MKTHELKTANREVNIKLLCLVLFIYALSIGIFSVVIPLYAYNLGANRIVVGFTSSAFALAYVVVSPLWGKVSDRLGRKLALGIGVLESSIIIFLFSFASNPELLIVVSLLLGFGAASFWIVPTALIADLFASQELGEAFGKVALFQGMGFIIGPFLGGFLVEQLHYHYVFYICSALEFSTALLIFLGLETKSKALATRVESSSKIEFKFRVTAKKSLAVAYVDTAIASLFLGVIDSQFVVHASEILGKKYLVGALLTSYYIAETFIQLPAGKLSDVIGRHRTILLAFVLSTLGFLTIISPPSFSSLLLAALAVGGCVGILYVAPTALLMDGASPSQRGLIAGFQNIAWGVGFFLGPMLGGIVTIYSVSAPYILGIIVSIIGLILTIGVYTKSD